MMAKVENWGLLETWAGGKIPFEMKCEEGNENFKALFYTHVCIHWMLRENLSIFVLMNVENLKDERETVVLNFLLKN